MKLPPNKMCRKTSYRKKWHTKIRKSSSSGTSSFCGGVYSNVFKCALHKCGSHTRKRWVNCQVNFKAAKTSQSLKDQSITQRPISACNSSIYFWYQYLVRNIALLWYMYHVSLTGLLINDKSNFPCFFSSPMFTRGEGNFSVNEPSLDKSWLYPCPASNISEFLWHKFTSWPHNCMRPFVSWCLLFLVANRESQCPQFGPPIPNLVGQPRRKEARSHPSLKMFLPAT